MAYSEQFKYIAENIDGKKGAERDKLICAVFAALAQELRNNSGSAGLTGEDAEDIVNSIELFSECIKSYILTLTSVFDIAAVTAKTESLTEEYNTKKSEYDKKVKEKRAAEEQIKAIDVELNGALEDFKKIDKEMKECEEIKKKYSSRKLEKVKEEAKYLEIEVTQLVDTYNKEITGSVMQSFNESLKRFKECFDKIKAVLPKESDIENTIEEAEDYKRKLNYFVECSQKYQSWFNTVKTPMDKFCEHRNLRDSHELGKKLTDELVSEYDKKAESIKQYLNDVEQIVTDMSAAAKSDYITAESKAQPSVIS